MWSWKDIREFDPGLIAAVVLILFFLVAYIALGWHNFTNFNTGVDLAGYTQEVYNLSHGRLPLNTFKGFIMWGDHAHFIMVLLAPFYRLWPDARLILIVQTLAVTTAGWPLYRVAHKISGQRVLAVALLYAYLAFVGIQYALDFDFHPSVLTGAAIVWMFYGFVQRKPVVYWVAFALGLLTREDAAPIFFMVGIYWLLYRRWLTASLTMALSASYFLLVAYFVMPLWSPDGAALLYLEGNEKDVWSIVRGFFFYPDAILQNMFDTEQKVRTITILFTSFGLLPLLSPLTYLAAAPIFYSRFNNTQDYRWLINNHSNANILPVLAIGVVAAAGHVRWLLGYYRLERFERAVFIGWAVMLVIAVHLTAWADPNVPLRRLAADTFVSPVPASTTRYQLFREVHDLVPPEAPVAASSGFLAHIGNRERLYTYPDEAGAAEWLILSSTYGNPWPLNRDQAAAALIRLERDTTYIKRWEKAGIYVFQRVTPQAGLTEAARPG